MQRRRQGEHTVHIRHGLRRARIRKRRWCQQTRGAPSHAAGRGPHTPRTDRHACTFTTTSHSTLLPREAPQSAKRGVQYKQDYIKAAPHTPLTPGFQVSHHRWRSRSWRHTQESAPHCDDNKQQKSAAAGDSAERKGATTQIKRLRQRPRQRCWTNTWGSARTKREPRPTTRVPTRCPRPWVRPTKWRNTPHLARGKPTEHVQRHKGLAVPVSCHRRHTRGSE